MMEILLVVLAGTPAHAKPSPPGPSFCAVSEAPAPPAYGGVAAFVVGGLSLATRLRRR